MFNRCMGNISCLYKEYRLIDGVWKRTVETRYFCTGDSIGRMVDCQPYFTKLGGYMSIWHKKSRRFGVVVNKIVSVSICRCVKKVFVFNYDAAQVYS